MSEYKGVLRPLKSGGFSYCKSPEHLVGKGRCNHLPGMAFNMSKSESGLSVVEVQSVDFDSNMKPGEYKVEEKELNDFVLNLDKELSRKKKEDILNFFKTHNI